MDSPESNDVTITGEGTNSGGLWQGYKRLRYRYPLIVGCLTCLILYVCLIFAGVLALDIFFGEFPSSRAWEDKVIPMEIRPLDAGIYPIPVIDQVIESHSKSEKKRDIRGDEREGLVCQQDIDGDGILDFFVSGQGFGFHFAVSGNPRAFPWSPAMFPSGDTSLGFDDVDGDRIIDAWVCDPGDMVMMIFWGNREMSKYKRQGLGGVPYTAKGAFYDVDGDGDLDVVLKVEQTEGAPQFSWIELSQR